MKNVYQLYNTDRTFFVVRKSVLFLLSIPSPLVYQLFQLKISFQDFDSQNFKRSDSLDFLYKESLYQREALLNGFLLKMKSLDNALEHRSSIRAFVITKCVFV